jgi:hypothetical protein
VWGAVVLLGLAQAPAQPPANSSNNGLTPEQIEMVQRLAVDVKDLRAQINRLPDGQARQQMLQTLSRLEGNSRRFTEITAGAARSRMAVPDAELAKLVRALKSENFDEKRLPLLRAGAVRMAVTSDQARAVVLTFASSDSRKRAALLLFPHVLDPTNFSLVLNTIPFAADRDDVVRAITMNGKQ